MASIFLLVETHLISGDSWFWTIPGVGGERQDWEIDAAFILWGWRASSKIRGWTPICHATPGLFFHRNTFLIGFWISQEHITSFKHSRQHPIIQKETVIARKRRIFKISCLWQIKNEILFIFCTWHYVQWIYCIVVGLSIKNSPEMHHFKLQTFKQHGRQLTSLPTP